MICKRVSSYGRENVARTSHLGFLLREAIDNDGFVAVNIDPLRYNKAWFPYDHKDRWRRKDRTIL